MAKSRNLGSGPLRLESEHFHQYTLGISQKSISQHRVASYSVVVGTFSVRFPGCTDENVHIQGEEVLTPDFGTWQYFIVSPWK